MLQLAISSSSYKNSPNSQVEDVMLLQLLILGMRDNQTHERLPIAENALSFDSSSRMARNHENITCGLTKLQIASVSRICKDFINETIQHIVTLGGAVSASAAERSTLHFIS